MLKSLVKHALRNFRTPAHEWFTGDYATWEEARSHCSGYDSPAILEKVRDALLKVKNGEAVYERDSVLFDKVEYSLPLLVFLLYVATASNNSLDIIDLGGSLGSTYFQNRKFLNKLDYFSWSIVEQTHFVECGKQYFAGNGLKFFHSIAECKTECTPNVILLSSVLPYLPNPYLTLAEIKDLELDYVIVDRTPFITDGEPDRVMIHRVPPEIYRAEIPTWFLNFEKFTNFMAEKYEMIEQFPAMDGYNAGTLKLMHKAIIFKRKGLQ